MYWRSSAAVPAATTAVPPNGPANWSTAPPMQGMSTQGQPLPQGDGWANAPLEPQRGKSAGAPGSGYSLF